MQLVDGGEPLIATDAKVTLTSMNLANAVSMIESCADVGQLDKWNKTDTRKGVHEAIAKRAAELVKPDDPAADAADAGDAPAE